MKTSYELTIKSSRGRVRFKGIFYKDEDKNKFYFRALEDTQEYSDMFEQLLGKGSIDIFEGNIVSIDNKYKINDYDIKHTIFETIDDLVLYLRNDGFLIESQAINEDFSTLSVIVDGKDLNPEVISLKEHQKITNFTHSLFQYANNTTYEPKYKIRASSFAVDIQEFNSNDALVKEFVNDIINMNIDIYKYFENKQYSKMIQDLKKLLSIESIKSFKIETHSFEENISLPTIKEFIKEFSIKIKNRPFTEVIKVKNLRAFDDKKLRVQYDADKIYSIHVKDKDVYDRLKKVTEDIVPVESYFISKQTILLNDFEGNKN